MFSLLLNDTGTGVVAISSAQRAQLGLLIVHSFPTLYSIPVTIIATTTITVTARCPVRVALDSSSWPLLNWVFWTTPLLATTNLHAGSLEATKQRTGIIQVHVGRVPWVVVADEVERFRQRETRIIKFESHSRIPCESQSIC